MVWEIEIPAVRNIIRRHNLTRSTFNAKYSTVYYSRNLDEIKISRVKDAYTVNIMNHVLVPGPSITSLHALHAIHHKHHLGYFWNSVTAIVVLSLQPYCRSTPPCRQILLSPPWSCHRSKAVSWPSPWLTSSLKIIFLLKPRQQTHRIWRRISNHGGQQEIWFLRLYLYASRSSSVNSITL